MLLRGPLTHVWVWSVWWRTLTLMDHMLYKSLLHRVTTEHVRNLNVCVCMGQSFSFASAAVVCRMLMCRPLQPQAMQNGTLLLESGCVMRWWLLFVSGFTYLPLMLVHGLSSVAQVVLEWLRNSFDCCVAASKVDESCLQMLAVKYATTQSKSIMLEVSQTFQLCLASFGVCRWSETKSWGLETAL